MTKAELLAQLQAACPWLPPGYFVRLAATHRSRQGQRPTPRPADPEDTQ